MMAGHPCRSGRKRKVEEDVSTPQPAPTSPSVNFHSPSILLLGIPAGVNTGVPVWDAVMSQQVNIDWRVAPYGISVHFTPKRHQMALRPRKKDPDTRYDSQLSQVVFQPGKCQPGDSLAASHVLLTINNSEASTSETSIFCNILPLPLVISPSSISNAKEVTPMPPPPRATSPSPLSFHTKRFSTVKICDRFLLGVCSLGLKCNMHHTPLPFHWQLRYLATRQWVDFPLRSQILMERLYCDANQEEVDLKDGNRNSINLLALTLRDRSKYDGVRRLTNTDDPDVNPFFPSKWRMYWWHKCSWQAYKEDMSEALVKKMNAKDLECCFDIGSQGYKVDFVSMTQTSVTTGYQRKICCRPVYRSPASMEPYLQTGILKMLIQPPKESHGVKFDVDPLEGFSSWYPPMWSLTVNLDYNLVGIPEGTRAYRSIQTVFNNSLPETQVDIISIQLVQNLVHWDKYQRYKVHMQTRQSSSNDPQEKHLFHGTTKAAAEDICHNNFDPRMAGVNGVCFGYGSYFASRAVFSDIFSSKEEVRHMFLAKVLVGNMSLGQKHYRRPPPLFAKKKNQCQLCLYDSCVDNLEKPTIFVVFDSCQCYPYYLITYRELPKVVNVKE